MDPNTKTMLFFALFFLYLTFPIISFASDGEVGMFIFVLFCFAESSFYLISKLSHLYKGFDLI